MWSSDWPATSRRPYGRDLGLPVWLTLGALPFIYLVGLLIAYGRHSIGSASLPTTPRSTVAQTGVVWAASSEPPRSEDSRVTDRGT